MKTITIATYYGRRKVQCYYTTPSGFLAVHRAIAIFSPRKMTVSSIEWTITHLPTGFAVGPNFFESLPRVRELAKQLDGDRWDFDQPSVVTPALKKWTKQIIRSWKSAVPA